MKNESVILPGSYDPITVGHEEILKKAANMYAKVYIVAFRNPDKTYMFTPEERRAMLEIAAKKYKNVIADVSEGMVTDYMRAHGIRHIIKGIRSDADLAYEKVQEEYNFAHGGFPTEYIRCEDAFRSVSSTLARERLRAGLSLDGILSPPIIAFTEAKFRKL